jgi:hypothetical protein
LDNSATNEIIFSGVENSPIILELSIFLSRYYIMQGASQRLALAAGGRDEIRFESRKSPKPEKCSKMRQNPTSRLHALLARLWLLRLTDLKRRHRKLDKIIAQTFDFGNHQKTLTYQNADQAKPAPIKRNADFWKPDLTENGHCHWNRLHFTDCNLPETLLNGEAR